MPHGSDATEAQVAQCCQGGDLRRAAELTIECYGPEILGYLTAVLRDPVDAEDVFAQFCADLWTGIPAFRWRSSLRTWAYALARHACCRFRADPYRRRGVALSTC